MFYTRTKKQNISKQWTLEKCLSAIRTYEEFCAETGTKATRDGYQVWHKGRTDVPSIAPIEEQGSWNAMRLRAQSVAVEQPLTIVLNCRRWTRDECLSALRTFRDQKEGKPRVADYMIWSRENMAPSYETLCEHFGGWRQAVAASALSHSPNRSA